MGLVATASFVLLTAPAGVGPMRRALALGDGSPYAVGMAGPSTKPRGSEREPVMVPHPDDVEAVREALDQADRGELLSADESEAYLRQLDGKPPPKK
jgi:hypothetical protein